MIKDVWKARWTKVAPLGRGGHGFTYSVRLKTGDGSMCVLKELIKQNDAERRARMHREVASLETLTHSRIAKFIESNAGRYKDDEELYLVTEFIPGENLAEVIKKRRPSIEEAIALVLHLLEALEYCHQRSIIHRDLKPENIILRNSCFDDPFIIDFGQSFNLDEQHGSFISDAGQHIGNRFVILPEYTVVGDDKRDRVSDITQMVAVLFYALTGVVPGHMTDGQNRKPHERPPALAELEKLDQRCLTQVSRIFGVGFSNEKLRRWQTIPALRAEALKVLSPEETDARSFEERIAALKQRVAETPRLAIVDQIDRLTGWIVAAFEEAWRKIEDELGDMLRDKSFGTLQDSVAPGQAFRAITFKVKYAPENKTTLAVIGSLEEGEYVLLGCVGNERQALCRFGLFDPAAKEIVSRSVQYFLCVKGSTLAFLRNCEFGDSTKRRSESGSSDLIGAKR